MSEKPDTPLDGFHQLDCDNPTPENWKLICGFLDACPEEPLEEAIAHIESKIALWPRQDSLDDTEIYQDGIFRWWRAAERRSTIQWGERMLRGENNPAWSLVRLFFHAGANCTAKRVQGLADCTHLRNLDALIMSRNKLSGVFAKMLVTQPHFQSLRLLALDHNNLGKRGAKYLADGLPNLQELYLGKNKLGDEGVGNLCQGQWPALRRLSLRNNNIGPQGAQTLAQSAWPNLEHLDLSSNPIGASGLAALSNSASLRTLQSFQATPDTDPDEALFKEVMPNLRHLKLGTPKLADNGAHRLAAAAGMPSLIKLDLFRSSITGRGAEALFASRTLCEASHIDLAYNEDLGDEGVMALARASHWKKIEYLHLYSCGLTSEGVMALVKAKHLSSLKGLFVSSNDLDDSVGQAIAKATHLKNLQYVSLGTTHLSEETLWRWLRVKHLKGVKTMPKGDKGVHSTRLIAELATRNLKNNS